MEIFETLSKLPIQFKIHELHPLLVHFPVGLLFTALIFYLFSTAKKSKGAELAGLSNLIAGTLFSYAAVYSGILAEDSLHPTGAIHDFVELHEKIGFAAAGIFTILSLWGLIAYRRPGGRVIPLFIILFLIAGAILGLQGYIGGYLVYEGGLGVRN